MKQKSKCLMSILEIFLFQLCVCLIMPYLWVLDSLFPDCYPAIINVIFKYSVGLGSGNMVVLVKALLVATWLVA